VGVLVTRPEHQAMPLCRLLENEGATTVRLPAVEIKPIGNRRETSARLGDLAQYHLIVFTSTNAVRFGSSLLDQKRDLTLAALGPATAHALNQAGYRVAVQPDAAFDSEGLLHDPRLEHVTGRRVLIVKGRGGRPLLAEELTRRGAHVVTADVYQRLPSSPTEAALTALLERFAAGEVQVITATSLEIAVHLLAIVTPALREEFQRVHWLVAGPRVAAGVRQHGLAAPLLQSDSALDQDLVAALLRWRSGTLVEGI
jgi:uroporphyrinogen-III synthase